MPNLNDIAIFVEVAKLLHLGRSADKLDMPASTISRRLRCLERELGIALLIRTTRGMLLTDAGTLYFDTCRELIEQAADAHHALRQLGLEPTGTLRISLPDTLAPFAFVGVVREFCAAWPGIDVLLDYSAFKDNCATPADFDIALRWGVQPDSDLVSRHLASVPYRLYACASYLDAHPAPASPPELRRHQCLGTEICSELSQWTLRTDGETVHIAARAKVRANNLDALADLVRGGAGIAALPAVALGHGLVPVLPDWSVAPIPLYALQTTRHPPARARAFLHLLQARLQQTLTSTPAALRVQALAAPIL
ncbi:LysR family transcriptional regulator [Achromobacter sp. DH1f]|uniref:LysR family transcriptional regulator n=1 Tax=Achromobacter sp. DH1f TaxID=1397275 RepID=UPI00046992CA|nr:LysR family transcriptional regulator [Achromobacter sp. DH1f]